MRLHLDRDRDEPFLWEETVRLEPEAVGPDLLLALGPIDVAGRMDLVDPEFVISMELRYDQSLACTRCLAPVSSAVAAHVDVRAVTRPEAPRSRHTHGRDAHAKKASAAAPAVKAAAAKGARGRDVSAKQARARDEAAAAAELELEKEELGVLVVDGEVLDTEPLIQEQVLLEVPMKPLCQPECKGLCPRCGADRNLTPECCAEPATDERWEALESLRDRLSAEGR